MHSYCPTCHCEREITIALVPKSVYRERRNNKTNVVKTRWGKEWRCSACLTRLDEQVANAPQTGYVEEVQHA